MGAEHAVGQVIQMLAIWGPVVLLFVAILRLLWRAGDRRPDRDLLAHQQRLSVEIAALTEEIRQLRQQMYRPQPLS